MPKYQYKVIDRKKNVRFGIVDAKSKDDAKYRVSKMGFIILDIKIESNQSGLDGNDEKIIGNFVYRDPNGNIQISFGKSMPSAKELIVFTKQLATMISSGVPLVQSIGILSKQQANHEFTKILNKTQKTIENGSTFSASIQQFPEVFDSLYVAMIEAGESSGNLDKILLKLVTYMEKSNKIKSQIKSAMMYPVMVMVVAIGVVTGLLAFVVPMFAQQYSDSGKALPELTQMVIDLSSFFSANWSYLLGVLVASYFALNTWKKTPKGAYIFDEFLLKIPGLGLLLKKINVGRFCSTMSSMLGSGVSLLEALSICAASSGNKVIETFILSIRKAIEKGSKFSEPLGEGGLFPDMVVSMVAVGETTGSLDEMLAKVSDFYEEEVDIAIEGLLSMIEPVMIVTIGGIVGFIVIAMYLPIFEMAGNI